MRKMLLKGICQTVILMLALFLISVQALQLMNSLKVVLNEVGEEEISLEEKERLLEETEIEVDESLLQARIIQRLNRNPRLSGAIFTVLFTLIALSLFQNLFPWDRHPPRERTMILVNALLYLGCGIPFLFMGDSAPAIRIMNFLYTVILIAESVVKVKRQHTPWRVVRRIGLVLVVLVNLLIFKSIPLLVLLLIILRSVKQILLISFSQIRMDVLRKIIRKTYASEILMGLLLLIVAFSLLLTMMDPGIKDFEEALWFCFATVTTIGYGDVAAASSLGRVLSVILGIYGIIVVALITSIIVNFYNEMKSEGPETPPPAEELSPAEEPPHTEEQVP